MQVHDRDGVTWCARGIVEQQGLAQPAHQRDGSDRDRLASRYRGGHWMVLSISLSDLGHRTVYWDVVDGVRKYRRDTADQ